MADAATEHAARKQTTRTPRRFRLIRMADPSGVSGTGNVADGCRFSDGWVAVHWPGSHASMSVWPSIESVMAIHGHQGATVLEWLDPDEPTNRIGSG